MLRSLGASQTARIATQIAPWPFLLLLAGLAAAPYPAFAANCTAGVHRLIVKHWKADARKVVASARLKEDLNADALDSVELVMALELEFKMVIPDADAAKFVTVADVVTYTNQRAGNTKSCR